MRSAEPGYSIEVSAFSSFQSLIFEMLTAESCWFRSARIHFEARQPEYVHPTVAAFPS